MPPTKQTPPEEPALSISEARTVKEVSGWAVATIVFLLTLGWGARAFMQRIEAAEANIEGLQQDVRLMQAGIGRLDAGKIQSEIDKIGRLESKIDTIIELLQRDDHGRPR